MKNILFLIMTALFIFWSCKNEPRAEIGNQEQDASYRPYLNKEQVFRNKDSVIIKRVKFLDEDTKTITDYYGDGKSVRIIKYFTNDLQDGKTSVYFQNGKIQEVQYFKNGKQIDKDSIFYETGELRFVYQFEDDKKNGWMYRYDKKGHQEFAANYRDDKVVEVIDSLRLNRK